ncbi:hypothetical protein NDU88_005657 [Pleurodeles waltl]|uniref:Uncharacterized protein n=1 Tax=Pleurodeles waltl TaxID=8319 RepID=A0AAV7PJ60_PLEWA|nr:hypothetical protein NDU88_005657 [Pleurodeles waltl]
MRGLRSRSENSALIVFYVYGGGHQGRFLIVFYCLPSSAPDRQAPGAGRVRRKAADKIGKRGGGEALRPVEIMLCGFSKSCKSPPVENRQGPRSSGSGRRSSVFGAEQALSTEARSGFSRRPRSVPPSLILLQSRQSGEAGLPARPTLAGPRRMPGRNSTPAQASWSQSHGGLGSPSPARPISPDSPGLVAEAFEALGSQGAPEGRWVMSAAAVQPPPPPRV